MASSPVTSHITQRDATLDDCLDVTEHTLATIAPAAVKVAEELNCNKTDTVALFKMKN